MAHPLRVRRAALHRDPAPTEGERRSAESDVSMALGAAFIGTLVLGELVGADTHSELLALLAVVAGIALVFETVTLRGRSRREHSRDAADPSRTRNP